MHDVQYKLQYRTILFQSHFRGLFLMSFRLRKRTIQNNKEYYVA